MNLNNIQMKRESKSFTDALYAILTAAQQFEGPKYMLSGLSGMAFKFSVHRRLLPMSVTAYGQWGNEHAPAIDNLGIHTAYDGGRTRHSSFEVYQQDAIAWIKQSIDAGVGALYWIPEFGVIHGYNDADKVFYLQDGWSGESQVVLYDNFGINFTSFWYCQVFGNQVEVPLKDAVLESLRLALYDWETPYKTWPDKEIASGRLAYSYLIQALKLGDFDSSGAAYILDSYVYARREIRDYLQEVHQLIPGLDEVHHIYSELADLMTEELAVSLPSFHGTGQLAEHRQASLCAALAKAEALEERAMERVRIVSERYPDRKRSIVPRWGAHSAR
ncbi:hypothetical protein NYE80_06060 [Paenibacillus sp. FSL H7-0357]|uniref:hypothetical protein n=1 Tax=Paenibacillus sp. FSL H7-0357 TaxID=1536774 RepID=UPI000ADC9522|nr:hypothetical protein [Paenibacillus sp. FSL H7-0357]